VSLKVMTWVFDESESTGTERLVLLAIADHADDETWTAWPSIERLAHKAKCSDRTVQRSIRSLADLGELTIIEGGGSRKTHRYTVNPQGRQIVAPPMESEVTPRASGVTPTVERGDARVTRTLRNRQGTADQQQPTRTRLGAQELRDEECQFGCGGSGVTPFGAACECFLRKSAGAA
jgi:hypothetical protein